MVMILKYIFRRITCKHKYKCVCTLFGTNTESRKEVELTKTYECVNCGKEIDVELYDDSLEK